MSKKLNIITICRNEEKLIEKTIKSVLFQTFKDFEYIIIDGGSTDKTVEIIKKYKKKISYFISEPDKGIYNAMNKGIKRARGEYLLFLNGGDYLKDRNVMKKVFTNNLLAEIVYGDLIIIEKEKETLKSFSEKIINYKYFFNSYLPHPSTFIKRTLFTKHGLYDESYKIGGDNDFFVREIVKYKTSYQYIPIVISKFNLSGISTNPQNSSIIEEERNRTLNMYAPTKIKIVKQMKRILNILLEAAYLFYVYVSLILIKIYLSIVLLPNKLIKSKNELIIAEFERFGGARTYFINLIKLNIKLNIRSIVILEKHQQDTQLINFLNKYKIKYYLIDYIRVTKNTFKDKIFYIFKEILFIFNIVKREKINTIVLSVAGAYRFIWFLFYPLKIVYILHVVPDRSPYKLEKIAIESNIGRNKQILTVSDDMVKKTIKFWGIEKCKQYISKIYLYTNFSNTSVSPNCNKKYLQITTIGHVRQYKNPDLWIKTAIILSKKFPNKLKFVWVGDGDLFDECHEKIKDSKNINFVGEKSQSEIVSILNNTDIYFQPSKFESFGISVVDAMYFQIPCIVTECGGMPEIVKNNLTGFVISDDKYEFVEKFITLISNKDMRNKMGKIGHKIVKEKFLKQVWEKNMIKFYKSILSF